jgi:hypothetical protein
MNQYALIVLVTLPVVGAALPLIWWLCYHGH